MARYTKSGDLLMPLIHIEYDNDVATSEEIKKLSVVIQEIVSNKTDIKEVMVYASFPQIKVKIDPIEVFIEMSEIIMEKKPNLTEIIKTDLSAWKKESGFSHPINMTLIPMKWEITIGI